MLAPGRFTVIRRVFVDLANTAGGHTKIREVERIPTFQDVVNWAVFAEILSSGEARSALGAAKAKPQEAARQLHDMHVFREALQRTVSAIATGRPIEARDFAQVRAVITKTSGTSIAASAIFVLGKPRIAPVA